MHDIPFDLHALRAFVAVCEGASMNDAARKLNVTQSAISQLIKGLEAQTGLLLFDREFRPLRPTSAGMLMLELSKDLLEHAHTVAERLTTRSRQVQIRLGCVDSFSAAVSPALVRAISGRAREISLWSGLTPALSQQLQNRELDLAVCTEIPMLDPRIVQQFLFSEKFVAVVPRDMKMGGGNYKAVLADTPLLRYSRRSIIGQQAERYLRHIGLDSPRRFEFDMTDPLLDMVCAGQGYAITTPLCLWQSRHFIEGLTVVPLPDSPLRSRSFFLLSRVGEWHALAQEVLVVTQAILQQQTLPRLLAALPSLPENCIEVAVSMPES